MRIKELHLLRFGHFEDLRLPLDAGGPAFHLIYGANEAGKSTTLRALTGLLFGIPDRSPDTHTHGPDLRVAATLIQGSEEATFVRRKGRKNTLLDDRGEPVPESALQRFLPGVSEAVFLKLYGLSHDGLRRSAEALLLDGGNLGETLFEAGISGRGVRALLEQLRREAAELFLPNGRKPALNDALLQYREAQRRSGEQALRVEVYREQEQAIEQTAVEQAALRRQRRALSEERARLQRAIAVSPLLIRRVDYQQRLSALGDVPRLPENASRLRQEAEALLARSEPALAQHRREVRSLRAQLAELSIPETLVNVAPEVIVEIRDRLGTHRKVRKDLPNLRARLRSLRAEAQALLRRLGLPQKLKEAQSLRLTTADRAKIRALLRAHGGLLQAAAQSEAELAALDQELSDLDAEVDRQAADQDDVPAAWLERARNALGRAAGRAEIRQRREGLLSQLAAELDGLAPYLRAGRDPLAGPVPLPETAAEHVLAAERDAARTADLAKTLCEVEREQARLQVELAALRGEGEVPTEEDLWRERQQRDGVVAQVFSTAGPAPEGLHAVQEAVRSADLVADRLRRESARTARLARLLAELSDIQARQAEVRRLQAEHAAMVREQRQALSDFLARFSLSPDLSPAEARAATDKLGAFRALHAAERDLTAELSGLSEEIDTVCQALCGILGRGAPADPRDLAEVLACAERRHVQQVDMRMERAALVRQIRDRRAARKRLAQAHQANCAALQKWQAGWRGATELLRIPEGASVDQAQAVLDDHAELFAKLDEVERLAERVERLERDEEAFVRDVRRLRDRHLFELGEGADVDESADALILAYERARRDADARQRLEQALSDQERAVSEFELQCAQARNHLTRLCAQARVDSPDALAAVEQQAMEAARLSRELQQVTGELLDAAEGVGVAEIAAEVAGVRMDEARLRVSEIDQRLNQLDQDLEQVTHRLATSEESLRQLRSQEGAAAAAAEAVAFEEQARGHAQRYVRVRLAEKLLEREIRIYRERHKGPLIERAGALFARLTCGRYVGLDVDYDTLDEPTLLCRRTDGSTVHVAGLSDGSRDPLFLALRLASLERYGQGGPPVCLDDILIHADDDRAAAALAVLYEFAERTQVLFFTHHEHLCQLARATLPARGLHEHQLPPPPDPARTGPAVGALP